MFGSSVQDKMTASVFYLFDGEKDINKTILYYCQTYIFKKKN